MSPQPSTISPSLARSWLLCPAIEGSAVASARRSAADIVVLDLEDGVAQHSKALARNLILARLNDPGQPTWVRINDVSSPEWALDVEALAGKPGLGGIVLAKTESAIDVGRTNQAIGTAVPIVALVESARGINAARSIATHEGTVRLAFGIGDYRRDTGTGRSAVALCFPRTQLVLASRHALIAPPIDGPALTTDDDELSTDCEVSIEMGMTGKLCLSVEHPTVINRQFTPSVAEIEWAYQIIDLFGEDGSRVTDGSDLPKLARAKKIRTRAESFGPS